MKKNQVKIRLFKNLKLLTSFVGVLFVISGTLGLIFIQGPLNESQENRSKASTISGCGEACSSNANCDINFRCYYGVCRLAVNPTSTQCTTAPIVAPVVKPTATPTATNTPVVTDNQNPDEQEKTDVQDPPLKKGDDVIPKTEDDYGDVEIIDPDISDIKVNTILNENVPVDETAFDLVLKMLKDKQQSLPTALILIGIGLIFVSLAILLIAKLLNNRSKHIDRTQKDARKIDLESYQINSKNPPKTHGNLTKDVRIKKLKEAIEKQSKNQNPG